MDCYHRLNVNYQRPKFVQLPIHHQFRLEQRLNNPLATYFAPSSIAPRMPYNLQSTLATLYNLYKMESAPPVTWYLDSGASNHITPDPNSLSLHAPCTGQTKVMVGNGQ